MPTAKRNKCETCGEPARKRFCSVECFKASGNRECPVCGKTYKKSRGGKTCSGECAWMLRRKGHMTDFTCEVCGKTERMRKSDARGRRVCSDECRQKGGFNRKHPDVECQACGKMFADHGVGRKFCSRACYEKSRGGPATKKCEHCGKEFKPAKASVRFCSRACYDVGHRIKCTCERCGEQFESKASGAKFCGSCREIIRDERSRSRTVEITCSVCGKRAKVKRGRHCCSEECRAIGKGKKGTRRVRLLPIGRSVTHTWSSSGSNRSAASSARSTASAWSRSAGSAATTASP